MKRIIINRNVTETITLDEVVSELIGPNGYRYKHDKYIIVAYNKPTDTYYILHRRYSTNTIQWVNLQEFYGGNDYSTITGDIEDSIRRSIIDRLYDPDYEVYCFESIKEFAEYVLRTYKE